MEYKDIAAVSGKGGLFKIVKPTKTGVILESLDEKKDKLVVGMNNQVSVLDEISIYTNTEEGSTALSEVMYKIHTEFNGDPGVDKNSDGDELKSFLKHILPDYAEDQVYVSDIKKVVNWYSILCRELPDILTIKPTDKEDESE